MCPLVKEDKALQAVTRYSEWSKFSVLGNLRRKFLDHGRKEENRIIQSNGNPGLTSLAFRKQMLNELLETQERLGTQLITAEEVKAIQAYWGIERQAGTPYTSECKFWRWQPAKLEC